MMPQTMPQTTPQMTHQMMLQIITEQQIQIDHQKQMIDEYQLFIHDENEERFENIGSTCYIASVLHLLSNFFPSIFYDSN